MKPDVFNTGRAPVHSGHTTGQRYCQSLQLGGLPGPGRTAGLTGGSLKSAEPTDDLKHLQRAGPVFSL